MPYIKKDKRDLISNNSVDGLTIYSDHIECAGDLNYAFTMLLIDYYTRKGLNYQIINDIVGSLIGAKDEFQRRVIGQYESLKIVENGDVYSSDRFVNKGKDGT